MNLERWAYIMIIIALLVMLILDKCEQPKKQPCPETTGTHVHIDSTSVKDTSGTYKPVPVVHKPAYPMIFWDGKLIQDSGVYVLFDTTLQNDDHRVIVNPDDYVPYPNCSDTTDYKDSLVNVYGKVFVFDKVYDNKLQLRHWITDLRIPREMDTTFISVPVKSKPKRWGLGLQGGYQYNGQQFKPYFGVGISYNLIRF